LRPVALLLLGNAPHGCPERQLPRKARAPKDSRGSSSPCTEVHRRLRDPSLTIRLSPDVRRTQFSRTEPHSEGDSPSIPTYPQAVDSLWIPGTCGERLAALPPSLQKPAAPLSPCRPASVAEGRRNLISQAPLCQSLFSHSLPIFDCGSLVASFRPLGALSRGGGLLPLSAFAS
jgi:hypothetical protein